MLWRRRPLAGQGGGAPSGVRARRWSGEREEGVSEPALFRLKKERDPEKLFHLMLSNSGNRVVVENRFAFQDTVSRLAGAARFDHIENLLEHHKRLPHARREGFMVRIITLYGLAGMTKQALHTFFTMPLFGCTPTVKSFNAALSVLARARHLPSLSSFLNHAPALFRLRPDLLSLNIAVKFFCDLGLVAAAYSAVSRSRSDPYPYTYTYPYTYLDPDVVTYTTLLCALYKRDYSPVLANGVWNLMVLRGRLPNVATFNARVQFLVACGRPFEAASLMDIMRGVGVPPDAVTHNLVMKGFFVCGSADAAERVFYGFRDPSQKMYQTMIHYMCRARRFDAAFVFCSAGMRAGMFPSIDTLCTLVRGLVRGGRGDHAEHVLASVRTRAPPFSRAQLEAVSSGCR